MDEVSTYRSRMLNDVGLNKDKKVRFTDLSYCGTNKLSLSITLFITSSQRPTRSIQETKLLVTRKQHYNTKQENLVFCAITSLGKMNNSKYIDILT